MHQAIDHLDENFSLDSSAKENHMKTMALCTKTPHKSHAPHLLLHTIFELCYFPRDWTQSQIKVVSIVKCRAISVIVEQDHDHLTR